jgi:glutathione reductase (NADPH)
MAKYDYDLFVVGAGSGGVRAARMSAAYGARVGIAEESHLGGTCVNVGCIPKKLFVYAAHYAEDFADAAGYGWTVSGPRFDWPTLLANKNKEIARLNGVYRRLLDGAGVTIHEARATLKGPHTLDVGGETITAERILIATGGWPVVPDIPGKALAITSNEAFYLERLPKRVIIVGGGYIAVEFAGIFHGLGVETVQLYRGNLFLRGFDDDVRTHLAQEMRKKGVDLRFNVNIAKIERAGGGLKATLEGGATLEADVIMYATGRAPNSAGLGLDEAGVARRWDGAVVIDEYFRTNVPSIYALGDVTHRLELTPVAIAEAMAFARTVFKGEPTMMDYVGIPTAVFSIPPIGTVGYTEAAAREHCGPVDIYRSTFRALRNTLSGNQEQTMMKLVVQKSTDRVVGCHMVGPDAGEIVQGLAVALKCGATKAQFDATVGIHPTAAEEFVTMREPVKPAAQAAAE